MSPGPGWLLLPAPVLLTEKLSEFAVHLTIDVGCRLAIDCGPCVTQVRVALDCEPRLKRSPFHSWRFCKRLCLAIFVEREICGQPGHGILAIPLAHVIGESHSMQSGAFQIVKSTRSSLAAALALLVLCVIELRALRLPLVVES